MTTLTKTCSSCGLQKPLSAFLEMAGPQGATYGNICASCRKANRDRATAKKEPDDETRSTSGFKIDSDTKTQIDFDKQKLRQEIEERYYKDRDEADTKDKFRKEKVKDVAKKQAQHTKSFLEQRSVLEKKPKQPEVVPGSPEDVAAREAIVDTSGSPFIDTQVVKRKRVENPHFHAWLAWVDKTSPAALAAQREADKKKPAPKRKQTEGSSPKDAIDFAENNWDKEPSKKRIR